MPETNGNEHPVSRTARKRYERTEAKFFEDADKIIAALESIECVITAKSNPNTFREQPAYTDDSLINAHIPAKDYIKSKFKTSKQPYKNFAETRFELPSHTRKKK